MKFRWYCFRNIKVDHEKETNSTEQCLLSIIEKKLEKSEIKIGQFPAMITDQNVLVTFHIPF